MGLTSFERQKPECFKCTANNIYLIIIKIEQTHNVVKFCWYFIPPRLSLCAYYNLNVWHAGAAQVTAFLPS